MTKHYSEIENLHPIYDEWEWQEQGNCSKIDDPEIFFLEHAERGKEKRKKEQEALKICRSCPVKQKCLEHALRVPEFFGVWGGTTADERNAILRKRGRRIIK
jgi:WhiB family redox-sensing transcriptional regulator